MERREIVVVGAGVVGVSCALWLRRQGHEVMLVDRAEVAGAASFGNAATIADYACTPVPQPGIWRDMPGLLFGVDSPLAIRWSCIGQFAGWLAGFLTQCNRRAYVANTGALAAILQRTFEGYAPLLDASPEARAFIRHEGCLYAYRTERGLRRAAADIALRRSLGVQQDVLGPDELTRLEPALQGRAVGAILFPSARHLLDPQGFVQALAQPLIDERRFARMEIATLNASARGIEVSTADGRGIIADRVVIAGGPWSSQLAAQMGDRIRLGAERGYHVEFQLETPLFKRPTCIAESSFYMTPLRDGRLRAAGTIELSGLAMPLNPKRTEFIERSIRRNIQLQAPVLSSWVGVRPTMPDYLPVIGPSSADKRVIYAFGHQHLGITLGGATGRLVAQLVAGERPALLDRFSARRFA
ncbi:FAD-dependent oxidoreductase [Caballeronia sp. LP003]|uniref:NAD(P)/FAD-dependent oxidoreductase n=1 Tax=Caballeronia sp. LP003 TaxID=3038551 RepID=UPI00285B0063|nr:FAD-dependent oxidoreductase [Caballeronia sp. LP003]MDR5785353.1 FAD-dependent oxidoreductase [Caballeronia sp. LP003]